jgi:hypothetical protein
MSSSIYDPSAIMLLSEAFVDVLRIVTNSATRPLTKSEEEVFSRRIIENLMKVFELGVRDRSTLILAGLEEIPFSTDTDGKETHFRVM